MKPDAGIVDEVEAHALKPGSSTGRVSIGNLKANFTYMSDKLTEIFTLAEKVHCKLHICKP